MKEKDGSEAARRLRLSGSGRLVSIRVYANDAKILKVFSAAQSASIPRAVHVMIRRALPGIVEQIETYETALNLAESAEKAPPKKRRKATQK